MAFQVSAKVRSESTLDHTELPQNVGDVWPMLKPINDRVRQCIDLTWMTVCPLLQQRFVNLVDDVLQTLYRGHQTEFITQSLLLSKQWRSGIFIILMTARVFVDAPSTKQHMGL